MNAPLRLFEGYGIEIEWMIVDRETLDVRPVADVLLRVDAETVESEIERGPVAWSNELAAHLIEIKTNGPAASLDGLPALFAGEVGVMRDRLADVGARLMPTAMHPWMEPTRDFTVWPHEYSAVYEAYDRIFDCRGHGWANLQSVHVNLPFADDDELGRLHEAIRLVLPLVPALAASSPVVEGQVTGVLDNRLAYYRHHVDRVPSLVGSVIPEPVFTREEYDREILARIYRDLAPHDAEGVLHHEWANARGAIARFDRFAIEIRLLDVQEAPLADLAVANLVSAVVEALARGRRGRIDRQAALAPGRLAAILDRTIADGERARIHERDYLEALGLRGAATAGDVWKTLAGETLESRGWWSDPLDTILEEGPLARRILRALGDAPNRRRIAGVYRELCDCLENGSSFGA